MLQENKDSVELAAFWGLKRMLGSSGANSCYAGDFRFAAKRKDGARRLLGAAKAAAGTLWSLRDLSVGVGSGRVDDRILESM
jgi:hypothetical protein